MALKKLVLSVLGIVASAIVAVLIFSFDASDANIGRPPSIEDRTPAADTREDWAAGAARFTRNPLDRYSVYALFRGAAGATGTIGEEGRRRLLDLAAARALRDGEIQAAMIDQLIKNKDYQGAVYRFDALMRARPSFRPQLNEALGQFAKDDSARGPVVDVLATDPPWRPAFLEYLARPKSDLIVASNVLIGLRATDMPPRPQELRPFLSRLLFEGAADRAYSLWLSFLSEEQLARVGNVYDGQFEALRTEAPFDWTIMPAKNVSTRISARADARRGKILEVMFANAQVDYRNVYQHILLAPGRYTLSGDFKPTRLESERGLAWKVYCASDASRIAESPPISGTQEWSSFKVEFEVPETGCPSQIIRLELNSKVLLDRKVSGTLWTDDIAIVPTEE